MNIALVGPAHPLQGGVPHFTDALAAELRMAGHDVQIINFRTLHFAGRRRGAERSNPASDDAQRVLVPWKPQTWRQAAMEIAARDPAVILLMWWLPQFAPMYRGILRALPPELHARAAYLVHDVLPHERWPLDTVFVRYGLSAARHFVTLSAAEGRRLHRLLPSIGADAMTLAPHPVFGDYQSFSGDTAAARRELGVAAERVLLFFGFVRRYKGLDILLRALPEILAFDPRIRLLVTGPFHHHRQHYERQLRRLDVAHAVVIHDRYFSGAGTARCFAAADCVILPYRSATQSGVVPIANALGVPAIATRVGALTEAVRDGETGFLIPPQSPQAIADAVRRFYSIGGRPAFASALQRESQRHTWAAFVQSIEQLAQT